MKHLTLFFCTWMLLCLRAPAQDWALEAGSGFAFVYPHPQMRLWHRPSTVWEVGALWSPGINNFDVWSQTLALQGRLNWQALPALTPFAIGSLGVSLSQPNGAWQNRAFAGLGLGSDWFFAPTLGLTGNLQLLVPDPYSLAPFVLRPEIGLRWLF